MKVYYSGSETLHAGRGIRLQPGEATELDEQDARALAENVPGCSLEPPAEETKDSGAPSRPRSTAKQSPAPAPEGKE